MPLINKNQEPNRNAKKASTIIGPSSSSIAALIIQRNIDKGIQISIPSADTTENDTKNEPTK